MATTLKSWQKLNWDDLEAWTGSRSVGRGETYHKNGRVSDIALCNDGSVVATVSGSERYLTRVHLDTKKRSGSRLSSECSCPVGYDCKHGVAMVLELLAVLNSGGKVEKVKPGDFRLRLLDGEEVDADEAWKATGRKPKKAKVKTISDDDIRKHLESKSKDEIIDRLMEICSRDADARKVLADETALSGGRFGELLAETWAEMRSITAQEAWYNSWKGEGTLPDYSGLQKRMATLLAHGHADDLVTLGEELLIRGTDQINHSDDDGHTCCEIADCMKIVADAIVKSSLPDDKKLISAVSMILEDGFDACESIGEILDLNWSKAIWSSVADELFVRLRKTPSETESSEFNNRNYRRNRLGDFVIDSLDKAGRGKEARELCVQEAKVTGNYDRAVKRLITDKMLEEADQLAREGLESINPTHRGTKQTLQNLIAEIAAKRNDWIVPAALAAERFFESPSSGSYRDLIKAAKKAKCEELVEVAARQFLETGKRPDLDRNNIRRQKPSNTWPLPRAPLGEESDQPVKTRFHREGPHFGVLIQLAIEAKQPDEVLRWYDVRGKSKANSRVGRLHGNRNDTQIAKAIEATHPLRAIEIYLELASSIANETNTKTYPEVGSYLKLIKPLLTKMNRTKDWEKILAEFRSVHGRKPRLMEVIDRVDQTHITISGKRM